MADIRLTKLAKNGNKTAFSDWPFRSVAEVERVLASMPVPALETTGALRKVNLTDTKDKTLPEEIGPAIKKSPFKTGGVEGVKVGVSNESKQKAHQLTNLHHELQDQKEKVNALKTNATNTFKNTKYDRQVGHMLDLFDKREQELLTQELDAHKKMHDLAEAHMPDMIRQMFSKVLTPVVRGMAGTYKGAVKPRYTMSFIPGLMLQFQEIIELKQLRNGKGFVYRSFWLIATCVIDERNRFHYYVNTSVKSPVPNVTPVGSQTRGFPFTKPQDGVRLLSTHLLVDDQIDIALPTELPKSKKEIEETKFRNKEVKKVKVDEELRTITFLTDPITERAEQKLVEDILADLQGLFHSSTMHEKLKYRVARLVNGGSKITVWVGTPQPRISSEYKANMHKLDLLQHELDLSAEETDQIRRLLRGRQPHPSDVEGNKDGKE